MGTKRYAKPRMALIAAILACIALAVFASCKSNNQPNSTGAVVKAGAGTTARTPGALSTGGRPSTGGTPGAAGKTKGATDSAKPGAPPPGAEGKDAPAGPKVEVTDMLVDAPGVDFTGPGRYDVTISALLKEPWKPGVWDIVAVGEDGKEVGRQELFLALSESKPKMLMFNDFYCASIPVKISIEWTDKKADTGGLDKDKDKTDKGGKGGAGIGVGGGTKPPPPAGDKGGAKPPPPPAGGDKGGGKDGGGGEDATTE
jgi:hypothetical protein